MFQKMKYVLFGYPAICLFCVFVLVVSVYPYLWVAVGGDISQSNGTFQTLNKIISLVSSIFLLENPLWNAFLVLTLIFLGSSLEKIFGAPKFTIIFIIVGISASFYMSHFAPSKLVNNSSVYVAGIFGMNLCMLIKKNHFISQKQKISLAILFALLILFLLGDPLLPFSNILVGAVLGFVLALIVKPQPFRKIIERKWGTSLGQGIIILLTAFAVMYSSSLLDLDSVTSRLQEKAEEWKGVIDSARLQKKTVTNIEKKIVENNPIDTSNVTPIHVTGDTLYNAILESLLNLEDKVMVGSYNDSDQVFETLEKVLNDHPEIFYFDHGNSRYWSNGWLDLSYRYTTPEIERMRVEIQAVVKEIFNKHLPSHQSDFDKVKAVHDYIVLHTRYDYQNYLNDTVPFESYHMVGALLYQTAVCDGYAKATQYLLNLLGVETRHVTGTANGGLHAWNKVKIDGEWFNLDVTWDDPVPDRAGEISYRYFLVTDKHLKKDHRWEEELYPTSEATTYMHISRSE